MTALLCGACAFTVESTYLAQRGARGASGCGAAGAGSPALVCTAGHGRAQAGFLECIVEQATVLDARGALLLVVWRVVWDMCCVLGAKPTQW